MIYCECVKVCRLRILASFPDSPALEREHDNCGGRKVFLCHVKVEQW